MQAFYGFDVFSTFLRLQIRPERDISERVEMQELNRGDE
jgi:hypothetical protein